MKKDRGTVLVYSALAGLSIAYLAVAAAHIAMGPGGVPAGGMMLAIMAVAGMVLLAIIVRVTRREPRLAGAHAARAHATSASTVQVHAVS